MGEKEEKMRKFFSYVFGILREPFETIQRATKEKDHWLMTVYAFIWDNLLMMVFIGIVTARRLVVWTPNNHLPIGEIIINSLKFLLFCNIVLLVNSIVLFFVIKIFRNRYKIIPELFYSYLLNSVFLMICIALTFLHHFFQNATDRGNRSLVSGLFALISASVYCFWCGVLNSFSLEKFRELFMLNFVILSIVSVFAVFILGGLMSGI